MNLCVLAFVIGSLSPQEADIVQKVDAQFEASVSFLEDLVNINSGTTNVAGVNQVGDVLEERLQQIGFATERITLPKEMNRGKHLFATKKGSKGKKLLLIGHMDTVFEKDHPFQNFTRKGNLAVGPGVNDMKGGIVAFLTALEILKDLGHWKKLKLKSLLLLTKSLREAP